MNNAKRWLKRLVREEDAPTLMEYGLLVILIAFVALAGVTLLGGAVGNLFQTAASKYP
jgi:Flp pilus assembly pilin Flp